MVRLAGASALALTVMAATAPSAQAAHRHHYSASAGYHHYSGAHHYRVHYAYGRHGTRFARGSEMADRGTGFDQDGRHVGFRQGNADYAAHAELTSGNDPRGNRVTSSVSHVAGGRPRAWCGWYARGLVGSDPGTAYNLARNWAHWGRSASPGPGVIVVWPHHVGMITGQASNGQWIVKSGNDGGGMARERVRSISGAIAFRAG